jgi:hypothetical protein
MKSDITCMIKSEGQQGMVLIVCLIVLLMLSLIGIASITTSNTDMTIAGNEMNQTGSFYAAESGLEQATAAMITSYQTTGNPPSPLPSGEHTVGAFEYSYKVTDQGPAVNTTLDDGAYKDLYGLVKTFDIGSTGFDNERESAVLLEMSLLDALIPVFQFAVFYENDLEIAPGLDMTLGGRMHSNGNIYLQSDNNLHIGSYLTSTGNVIHGRKPGSGQGTSSGNVFIMDGDGDYQNMKNADGTFLDSTDPDWVNSSLSRWGGNVEDRNHGITDLGMSVVGDGPPTDLIDRGDGNADSYEHQAGLKIVDGHALYRQADGTWLNVTSSLITSGVISAGNFHDGRENRDVYSLDIDIGALAGSGYYPSNGIIYASQPHTDGYVMALRLKNGSALPSGLTVATDNPMYTLGDFNTVSKKPASLMADAITILSNSWDDANSWHGMGSRNATDTRTNACFMTGNTETGSGGHSYNGGLENLPRFLEDWSGATFTWRGSAADLWYSRQATGAWSRGSYYKPPFRNWGFDADLLDPSKLPPGTPLINIVLRTSWRQTIIHDYQGYEGFSENY